MKKIKDDIVLSTQYIALFKKNSVDHAPESPSKYITIINHYFCIKNEYFFRIFLKFKIS